MNTYIYIYIYIHINNDNNDNNNNNTGPLTFLLPSPPFRGNWQNALYGRPLLRTLIHHWIHETALC